ncbi:UNVERIFIED_ORG: NAD/NADP transhydrogenase beta subunit [Burkholderia sp. 1595]|uniref:NAD/NADP transhydrogenase beta subunit n=1 Tax=Paraburkholderia terricola TaxID=169427 RepID=A0ABU1LQL1_9BURK|nr:NAD/NADP transhydrogenase beta subunit [Paraburkholderia terricola]MDR6482053.1 NAD/NADP transhydrogenase beta subunit [Paraburkholderia terricola]
MSPAHGKAVKKLTAQEHTVQVQSTAGERAHFPDSGYAQAGGTLVELGEVRVEMTKMPDLIAAMHSLTGLAASCIAYAVVSEPSAFGLGATGSELPYGNRVELFIGTFIGAITFSGSVIAFGKLSGKYKFRLRAHSSSIPRVVIVPGYGLAVARTACAEGIDR